MLRRDPLYNGVRVCWDERLSTEPRTLTSAERRAMLTESDSYPNGDPRRGTVLRRSRLYTSQLATWRQRLANGATSLAPRPPGPVPQPVNLLAAEVARLQRENATSGVGTFLACAVQRLDVGMT
jgi:hypothetical protein